MAYSPNIDGIEKSVQFVAYVEASPPNSLSNFVHCFWELKTLKPLPEDFFYHILPDACVNILFDQIHIEVAAVTVLQTKAIQLNLGKNFHFIGIQLLPGVWRGDPKEIKSDLVDSPYNGSYNLKEMNTEINKLDFSKQQDLLIDHIHRWIERKIIVENPTVIKILNNLESINSVSDMAKLVNQSSRQVQRTIKKSTGFSPHDFLKILRLQQSIRQNDISLYSDQSHYIHSFKRVVGYTPQYYKKKFNV